MVSWSAISGQDDVVSYQDVPWSDIATIPEGRRLSIPLPLPGTDGFERAAGRAGDMLVIQLRSGSNVGRKRQASLRSLGLKGVNSVAIRDRSDNVTLGYIAAIRDLVAVIELDAVNWKTRRSHNAHPSMRYQTIEYGSNTRPGAVTRNESGDYFVYEGNPKGMLLNWSTPYDLEYCVAALRGAFGPQEGKPGKKASVLGVVVEDDLTEGAAELDAMTSRQVRGETLVIAGKLNPSVDILEVPTKEALAIVTANRAAVKFARIAFEAVDLTWHSPYARFRDDDTERAEAGLYSKEMDYGAAGSFVRATAPDAFVDGATIEVQERSRGSIRRIKF